MKNSIGVFALFCCLSSLSSVVVNARRNTNQEKVYHAQQSLSHEERIASLDLMVDAFDKNYQNSMFIQPKGFRQLIASTPRNFSAFVFIQYEGPLGESKSKGCDSCDKILEWWNKISWYHAQTMKKDRMRRMVDQENDQGQEHSTSTLTSPPIYFITTKVESDYHRKMVKVPVHRTKPNIYYFRNTEGARNPERNLYWLLHPSEYEDTGDLSLGDLVEWIKRCSGLEIDLKILSRPDLMMKMAKAAEPPREISGFITQLGLGLGGLWFFWKYTDAFSWLASFLEGIRAKLVKGDELRFIVMGSILWCISGQMFNHIRATGFAFYDHTGSMRFIARGHGMQMLGESYLISILYGVMSYTLIRIIGDAQFQRDLKPPRPLIITWGIVLNLIVFLITFIILLLIIGVKMN